MDPPTRIDPTLTITPHSRLSAMDQFKDQLTSCAEGRHTVDRLIYLAKDRLEPALDEIRPEDARELGVWLNSRAQAGTGEAKIKWDLIRGVFETMRDARGPNLCAPFERPLSAAVSDVSPRRRFIGFSEIRDTTEAGSMATAFEKLPAPWPQKDPVLAEEIMLLPVAPVPRLWRPTSFVWTTLGAAFLFTFAIEGSYWLTKRALPPLPTANLAVAPPLPRLVVGLPALTDQPLPDQPAAVPTVAQLPVLGPDQPLGLPPITHVLGLNLPTPVGEAPPPTEQLRALALPPEPALKATSHYRLSPAPTPGKSPGAVKF
jgi:hypothetical protein